MNPLATESLRPYRKDSQRLSPAEIAAKLTALPGWHCHTVDHVAQLQRDYTFPDFASALHFTNQIGALAEAANHHPQLTTTWGKVSVVWWTHAVQGLHDNDFIMAARCDALTDGQDNQD